MKESNSFLRSVPEDEEFHSRRVMFLVVDGKVEVFPVGSSMSHLEMAENMGWVNDNNREEFLENNPRGFYLEQENIVHFYKGEGFGFDAELEGVVVGLIPELVSKLKLKDSTKIFLGPRDRIIKGKEFEIKYVAMVGEIVNGD